MTSGSYGLEITGFFIFILIIRNLFFFINLGKKTQKTPKSEIEKAAREVADYKERNEK